MEIRLSRDRGMCKEELAQYSNTKNIEPIRSASRETLMSILETLPAALFFLDDSGIIVYANASSQALIEARPEQIIGKPLTQTLWWPGSPANHEKLHAAFARASQGESVHFEAMIQPKVGKDRALSATITRHVDADQHSYLIFAGIVVPAHNRVDQDIHPLIETLPQLVWIARPDGFLEDSNQRCSSYVGADLEHFNGDQWLDFVHPDDREKVWTVWQTALRTGQSHEVEYRLREGKTGNYQWFLVRGIPFTDEQGRILKWFGTCTDINDQKRIEEALRQSQERVRALIDSNLIGICCSEGEQEVIVEANEAFLQMSGYSREDVERRRLSRVKITPAEQVPLFEHALAELVARGQHTPFETELVCKNGSRLPILVGGVLFQDHPRQIVAFVLNNSARKELEQRKDDFINMAGHELRNPLTLLKMQTYLMRKRLEKQGIDVAAVDLFAVEGPVKQLERLVTELLDVSKMQTGRLEYVQEPVDLLALLRRVAENMQQMSRKHTVVVRGATPRPLIGDQDRLEQVFNNLISNAIKYSPDAQTVEIDLSTSQESATIRVQDHGRGIPREERDKIFERFYRAAGQEQRAIPGLGMGLYIVAEIVKHYGGSITVDSAVGEGSTFTVTLPLRR